MVENIIKILVLKHLLLAQLESHTLRHLAFYSAQARAFCDPPMSLPPVSGHGSFTLFDGATYTGEWANSKPHGRGRLVLPSGGSYEGTFCNGVKKGEAFSDTQVATFTREVGGMTRRRARVFSTVQMVVRMWEVS